MAEINQIFNLNEPKAILKVDKVLIKVDDTVIKLTGDISALSQILAQSGISFEKLAEVQKKTETTTKNLDTVGKQLIVSEKKLKDIQDSRTKTIIKNRNEAQKEAKIIKQNVIINNSLSGSYTKLTNNLNKNIAKYKDLSAKQRDNTKIGGRLLSTIQKQDAAVKKLDATMGRSQRHVGNYGGAIKKVALQFAGALGLTSVLFLFINALKGAFTTLRSFTKENAVLAGVLGKTRKEIIELTEQSIQLGAIYPVTASEVVKLQVSFARLGFTMAEIQDLTESTILGSIALNAELDATATLVGAVVKAYSKLGTSDVMQIIDQLTISTQKTSLSFAGLETALPKVAGAADALNFTLSKTITHLGIAVDATLDASIAGTSMRKIYLELANKGLTLNEALKEINGSTNKLKTSFDLFSARAAIVALALANNTEKAIELEAEIDKAGGTAERVAKEQMATLDGSLKNMGSSWEKLILQFRGSEGFFMSFFNGIAGLLDLMSGSITSATEKFNEQLMSVQKLQSELVPLIDEYENLQEKGELSADEQERMKILMGEIATITPFAITQIDEYGNVIEISTRKTWEFVQARKEMLKLEHVDAIKENEKALEKINLRYERLNKILKEGEEISSVAGEVFTFELDSKRIAEINVELQGLGKERKRLDVLLKGLKGEFLPTIEDTEIANLINSIKKATGEEINIILEKNKTLIDSSKKYNDAIQASVVERLKKIEIAEKNAKLAKFTIEEKIANLKKSAIDKEIEEVNKKYGTLITEARSFGIDITGLEQMLVDEIKQIRLDAEIEANEGIKKERDKYFKDLRRFNEKFAEDIKEEQRIRVREEIIAQREITNSEKKLELIKLQELSEIRAEAAKKGADELAAIEQQKVDKIVSIATSMGDALGALASGQIKTFKDFSKEILFIALDALEKQILITQVGILAKDIGTLGFFGVATAAIKIGLIKAAFSGIKGAIAAFNMGTENTPSKFIAGDKKGGGAARELMQLESGKLIMVNKPTYFEGNEFKGATIWKNQDTENIISQANNQNNIYFDTQDLKNEMIAVRKAIQRKPVSIVDNSGRVIGKQSGNYREIYIERLQNGR